MPPQVLEGANWSALILAKRAAASPQVDPELRARLADQHRLYLSRTCAFCFDWSCSLCVVRQ